MYVVMLVATVMLLGGVCDDVLLAMVWVTGDCCVYRYRYII